MAGGAAGAQFANPRSFLSITHLPLPESERSGEQLGLRLGQLVTPGGRESRTGLGGGGEAGQDLWSRPGKSSARRWEPQLSFHQLGTYTCSVGL